MFLAALLLSTTLPGDAEFTRDLGDQGTAELVAIGSDVAGPWWKPDGTPTDVAYKGERPYSEPPGKLYRVAVLKVTGRDGTGLISGGRTSETANTLSEKTAITIDGQPQDDLLGVLIYVDGDVGEDFKLEILAAVQDWRHGLCTVPERWRTTDDRRSVNSPDQCPMFIVRPLGDDTTQVNILHSYGTGRVRIFGYKDAEKIVGDNLNIGPLMKQQDGKLQPLEGVYSVQASFQDRTPEMLDRVALDYRDEEYIPFETAARDAKE